MHESTLMRSLIGQVEAVAQAQGARQVVGVTLTVGALTPFAPAHLRDHFRLAAAGTVAAAAHVTITVGGDPTDPHAQGIQLTSVEVV
jgi:Zn finger protein HypA/HybF involved in hydrogenase expression